MSLLPIYLLPTHDTLTAGQHYDSRRRSLMRAYSILSLMLIFAFHPSDVLPAQDKMASRIETKEQENYALFDFSRVGMGGMKHGYNAGAYVSLELMQNKKDPQKVLFRITTLIPEPHSRINSIGIDLGRFTNLFTRLETDGILGKHYHIVYNRIPTQEPAWPGFNIHYYAIFINDPKIAKPNDPRKLSPGNSLTIKASLAPGIQYKDVYNALRLGLSSPEGLRLAIFGQHLAGQPLPMGTRMDDGGYIIGRLIRASGPDTQSMRHETALEQKPTTIEDVRVDKATTTNKDFMGSRSRETTTSQTTNISDAQTRESTATKIAVDGDESESQTNVKPRNPWCRFCPEPAGK